MPFLPFLASTVLPAISNLFNKPASQTILGSVGSQLASKGMDKIFGVPTPPTGAEAGQLQKEFMDAAYPGTNPWERLHSGGGGQASPASIAASEQRNSRDLQAREFAQQKSLTAMNNRASVISSSAALGPQAMQSALGALKGDSPGDYDTQISLAKQRLAPEIKNLDANTQKSINESLESAVRAKLTGTEQEIKAAELKFIDESLRAGINANKSKSLLTFVVNQADSFSRGFKTYTHPFQTERFYRFKIDSNGRKY